MGPPTLSVRSELNDIEGPGTEPQPTGTVGAAPPPSFTPLTYKLRAFLSRLIGASGRRRVLEALPARHLAVPAAAERGGGGIGGPGGRALRRGVQPWPVPIHASPQLRGSRRRKKAAALQGTGGSPGVCGALAFPVPPPTPPVGFSPTAATRAASNTSENSRRR